MGNNDWIELNRDAETGIETIRAHFEGHAYDPHFHDSYLIGFTEQGVQQFHCRKALHSSTPGQVFLLEPGELHDGHAPARGGFTYSMLYLDPHWLERELRGLFEDAPGDCQPAFAKTLASEPELLAVIAEAFQALQSRDLRIVRQAALDALLAKLARHLAWRPRLDSDPRMPLVALRARDYLHAHMEQDLGLDELAWASGVDRFRLSRAFKAAFGIAPHAYLVQLRLARARQLLASGQPPTRVAMTLGFADQSHMGRWFRRAYGLTPAHYRRRCSNLPDR
ncbi:AraC family transcriptional regulator [Stutzerimonas stutzeri]|jgi:AraC-like DNA-binding protein|uniref:AraC family transcriptional regulator n=1 Tax=Stutzerimonas stutzeri TaxID=316 RepID=UPI0006AC6C80|nr:AraC family transcriptional regulator [Stutzerimonas stutzeri]HAG20125.1 AraC family transcriptional regulator [Pseudomonas sp.]AWL00392.1 AraC family transcriptional regulator [Stutzerimonas stutzeri]KOR10386.1 AraC family transcriptional regulator [Stutzerimonas stutzeri]MCQ4237713.1 AraC family transcriptional regulator [Stutzerimonas stutzeri]MDH0499788.1 AraC family transcriptional regulator [Stutzerimonas stutzeri]